MLVSTESSAPDGDTPLIHEEIAYSLPKGLCRKAGGSVRGCHFSPESRWEFGSRRKCKTGALCIRPETRIAAVICKCEKTTCGHYPANRPLSSNGSLHGDECKDDNFQQNRTTADPGRKSRPESEWAIPTAGFCRIPALISGFVRPAKRAGVDRVPRHLWLYGTRIATLVVRQLKSVAASE